jgi:hypothetical protein
MALTLKSATTKLIAAVVPPPGGGFTTVIFSVPLCARSLGIKVTCRRVELK